MLLPVPPRRWAPKLKPPIAYTLLNRQHPLSRGLTGLWYFNEGAGKAFDLLGVHTLSRTGAVSRKPTKFSVEGAFCDGAAGVGYTCTALASFIQSTTLAVWTLGYFTGTPDVNSSFGGIIYDSAQGSPFCAVIPSLDGSGNLVLDFNAGGSFVQIGAAFGAPATNTLYSLVGQCTDGQQDFWVNVSNHFTGVNSGNVTYGVGPFLQVGSSSVTNTNAHYVAIAMATWNRLLTQNDVETLQIDPYVLAMPPPTWVLHTPGGSVANTKSLFATQAETALLQKRVGAVRLATQAETAVITKQVAATKIAGESAAAIVTKQVATTKIATQAETPTLLKQVSKIAVATQAMVAQLTTLKTKLQTLIATQPQAALLVKQAGKFLALGQAQASTLTKQVGKILLAPAAAAVSLVKQVNKTLLNVQAQLASLAVTRVIQRTLIATQPQAALIVKQAGKFFALGQAQAASLVKQVQALRIAGQAQQAAATKQIGAVRIAGQASAATLGKLISKIVIAVENAVALLTKVLPGGTTPRAINFGCSYTTAPAFGASLRAAMNFGASE